MFPWLSPVFTVWATVRLWYRQKYFLHLQVAFKYYLAIGIIHLLICDQDMRSSPSGYLDT